MGNPQCRWVRDRLPLLTGNDLVGTERRRVERHLIGCPDCRQHRQSLSAAFGALRSAAQTSPVRGDSPSLWPAVARQIRESRRPALRFSLPWVFSWSRVRLWPTLGLSMGLLVALTLNVAIRHQTGRRQADTRRLSQQPISAPGELAPVDEPSAPAPVLIAQPTPATETTAPPRFDYDLERGTPMGPDSPDVKSKLTH